MKLLRSVLFIIHIIIVLMLFGTVINAYVPPSITSKFNFLSLAFPLLLIVHLLLTLMWIVLWKKRAFVFLLFTFFLYHPITRWVNYSQQKKGQIKVITLNAKFGKIDMQGVKDFLKKENADVVFLQENNFQNFAEGNSEGAGIVKIVTKHRIINHQKISIEGETLQNMYADVVIGDKTVRLVNVHLQSFLLDKDMVRPVENPERNKEKFISLLYRMSPVFKEHEAEIKEIRKVIDNSPYPVILAGDFNSVPNSWEYYHLGKGLEDAFMKAGSGSATSFDDYKFPIRIDYIFTSKNVEAQSYKVNREKKISDHYPVITEFNLK